MAVAVAVAVIAATATATAAVTRCLLSYSGLGSSLIQNLQCLKAFFGVGLLLECSYYGRLTQSGSFVCWSARVIKAATVLNILDYFEQSSLHLLEIEI